MAAELSTGAKPQANISVWAPGRINLIGEHTDYSGGLALPAAIQRGITVQVTSTGDHIRLSSDKFGPGEAFAPDGRGERVQGWSRLAQAVAGELDKLGRTPVGIEGTIKSDLPSGLGLSSSAALEVAVALALCVAAEFRLDPLTLADVCRRAETSAVHVPCGVLDQAACLLGAENSAVLIDCTSLEHRAIPIPNRAVFLVFDSGVKRTLETTRYADRRRELEHAMQLLGVNNSREIELSDIAGLNPLSTRRLRHVAGENRRVVAFAHAIANGDLSTAGHLMSQSHASLRDDYEVSTPEVNELVELACSQGARGARLVGGGFGGAVLALVDASAANEVANRVKRAFSGGEHVALVVRPSRGAYVTSAGGSGCA